MGGITRLNQLPDGSGLLSSDDIFLMMDDPSGSAVTKKISLSQLGNALGSATVFQVGNIDLHNGGVQSAQILQFNDDTKQSVITGPTPPSGDSARRIIIQGQRAVDNGEGGDVYLWGGDSDINGGDIKIYAGDADSGSSGQGGYVNIDGGKGVTNGGNVEITGGYSEGGQAGDVSIVGGPTSSGVAGDVNIKTNNNNNHWTFGTDGRLTLPPSGLTFSDGTTQTSASYTPRLTNLIGVSGTISTDPSLYSVFNISLSDNATLNSPSSGVDGQRCLWRIKRTNGQVLSLHNNFRIINGGVINNTAHTTTFIDGIYDSSTNKWDSILYNNLSSTLFLTMDSSPFVDSVDENRTIEVTPTAILDTVNTRAGTGSLSVDQNGHLYSTDVADVNLSGDFTISLSIKPTGVPGVGYGFPFVTTTLSNGNTNGLFLTWNLSGSGTLIAGRVNTSNIATSSAGVAPIDEWTDVVVTRSGSTIKIFANTVPVATGTSDFAFQCTRLNIGEGDNVGAGAGFIGNIDEFKIINGQAIEP